MRNFIQWMLSKLFPFDGNGNVSVDGDMDVMSETDMWFRSKHPDIKR